MQHSGIGIDHRVRRRPPLLEAALSTLSIQTTRITAVLIAFQRKLPN